MKAIDTNVLVRLIVMDNDLQSRKALRYVQKNGEVFISMLVLCEATWVFTSCYDFTKKELEKVLQSILCVEQFVVEKGDSVWSALHSYQKENCDFSDCLIGVVAHHHGCQAVATFDKRALVSHLFEVL